MINKKTNTTSKKGVNSVRTLVEESECFYHKIEQENDLGIDAIIEFFKDERPLNKSIAIQIKSGPSYYNSRKNECIIPIDSHREYWQKYTLPVYGIVYIPELKVGYWVDIKSYLEHFPEANTIRFLGNRANQFDFENFNSVFIPRLTNTTPDISLPKAIQLFDSADYNEFMLGSIVLFRKYINEHVTWNKIVNFIINPENIEIPSNLIYYLAHIPWHSDIYYSGEPISRIIKTDVLTIIKSFDREVLNRLLNQIDEEDGIERGTIGQSIEAIISKIERKKEYLEMNIIDKGLSINVRHLSIILYCYYYNSDSLKFLKKVKDNELWMLPDLIENIRVNRSISIY